MKVENYIKSLSKGGNNTVAPFFVKDGTITCVLPFYSRLSGVTIPDGQYTAADALKALIAPGEVRDDDADEARIPESLVNTITIPAGLLCGMLPFASKEDVRYYLNGVCVSPAAGGGIVATNGHILHHVKHEEAVLLDNEVIIPRDFLEFAKSAKAENIEVSTSGASFNIGALFCQDKLIEGKFPQFENVIPARALRPHDVELPDYATAKTWSKQAKILSNNNKFSSVIIEGGNFLLNNPGGLPLVVGKAIEGITIGIMACYFELACKLGGILSIGTANDSAVIFGNNTTTVIMPVRI